MYAVIETGGQQYKVAEGDRVKVEFLSAELGSSIIFDQVYMFSSKETGIQFGQPYVAGAQVVATVMSHARHAKIRVFKMRRRKHYQKHQGHRQYYTQLQINNIVYQES